MSQCCNVVKCNLTKLTPRHKHYTCGHYCLVFALHFQHCILALRCILSIVIQWCVLALRCFARHLHPYYTLICSVCIQQLQLLRWGLQQGSAVFHCMGSSAVVLMCGQQCIQLLVYLGLRSPSLQSHHISWQLGVVLVLHVCSHVCSF